MSQMSQTLGRLLSLIVILAKLEIYLNLFSNHFVQLNFYLLFVNCVSFLLAVQRRSEVAHATLCACHEMIADGDFKRLHSMVFDVECESVFEEAQ